MSVIYVTVPSQVDVWRERRRGEVALSLGGGATASQTTDDV